MATGTIVSAAVDDTMLGAIDGAAVAWGVNRSEAIRILIRCGIDNPDRVAAFQVGYQEGLRFGQIASRALLAPIITKLGELDSAINRTAQSAASMRAVPVMELLPGP